MANPESTPKPSPGPSPTHNTTRNTTPGPSPTHNTTPHPTPGPSPMLVIPDPTGTSYPVTHLWDTARQVHANANTALDQLGQASSQLDSYASGFPSVMRDSLTGLFDQYEQRLDNSYTIQLLFASWLKLAADEVQNTDGQIKTSFQQFVNEAHGIPIWDS